MLRKTLVSAHVSQAQQHNYLQLLKITLYKDGIHTYLLYEHHNSPQNNVTVTYEHCYPNEKGKKSGFFMPKHHILYHKCRLHS